MTMSKTKIYEDAGKLVPAGDLPFSAKLWTVGPQQFAVRKTETSDRYRTNDHLCKKFYKYISRKF